MKGILLAALLILLMCAGVAWAIDREISVWGECLQDHSWYYCWRVLNH